MEIKPMKFHAHSDRRQILLNLFSASLAAVNGRRCVAEFLSARPPAIQSIRAIAIGKAAASMMQGVLDVAALPLTAGLVITKSGHTQQFGSGVPIRQLESAHPYPDQRSLDAGQALLAFIHQTPPEAGLLFLLSGGTSALVEVLPPGIDARRLHDFNQWLLAQGWPIDVMNRVRKSVSLIKAGRLAHELGGRKTLQLLISDVPGDDLSVIGSGLLVPSHDTIGLPETLPAWLPALQAEVPAPPAPGDPVFANIESHIIANNDRLRAAAAGLAQSLGFSIQANTQLAGEAAQLGRRFAQTLCQGPAGIYLWGGESVVRLPAESGNGGRCQHLALAAGCELAGRDDVLLLAAGSDGTDGPGEVAGALVDGQSVLRGRDGGGGDPEQALRAADAGSFLAASGDLIDTGPTGTNVMDLVIGLKT